LAFDQQRPLRKQLPTGEAQLRAGFYICNSVFQLFEDAYVDLRLEEEFDHPDNRGWMNFFRHWSGAPMFRVAWTISGSTYGARFQTFCERHLNLKLGLTDLSPVDIGVDVDYNGPATAITWTTEIGKVGAKIAEAIWTWVVKLPVGSEVIATAAEAAVAAIEKGNELPHTRKRPDTLSAAQEQPILRKARRLVRAVLKQKEKEGRFSRQKPECKDQEWHYAAMLLELFRRNVSKKLKRECATKVAELALSHGTTIVERFSTKSFRRQLSPTERELIERFFMFNPALAASARIVRLEITPDSYATSSDRRKQDLRFPFGFAILAKTEGPQRLSGPDKLVYLRVQDHLRRMGLARKALTKLLAQETRKKLRVAGNDLSIELKEMHPEGHEVPNDDDRGRLLRLYDSVRTEMEQKRGLI
jgi:hypothetical protein